jgi:SPP1 family predicted phage head-tail adaptor
MIGGKRHLLTLEQRAEALDEYGGETLTYSELATAWGSVEAVGARERFESQQIKAEVSHRITIRYSALAATLTAADRIVLGSRVFDIVTPMDKDGRLRDLEILALERP